MWWLKLRDDLPFWTSSRIYLVYHMETYERIKTKCSLSVISPDIPTPLPEEPDPVGRRWSNYWAHFCSHKYRRYLRFCPAINRRATLPTLKATGIPRMHALKVGRGLPRVMRKLGSTKLGTNMEVCKGLDIDLRDGVSNIPEYIQLHLGSPSSWRWRYILRLIPRTRKS